MGGWGDGGTGRGELYLLECTRLDTLFHSIYTPYGTTLHDRYSSSDSAAAFFCAESCFIRRM